MTEANKSREEFADVVCPVDDDRRRKTVAFVSETPDDVRRELETEASASRSEQQSGPGQVPLMKGERRQLDFSREGVNVPKYRAIKGVAAKHGVDDWLAYADHTLTVDEHREVMERATRDESGQRMDADRTDEQRARDLQGQAGSDCDHARDHCEHGDPAACEFLTDECGLSSDDVAPLLDEGADGVPYDDLDGATKGALSRAWKGYTIAVRRLPGILDELGSELANAERSVAAIRAIESQTTDEETGEFEALRGHHQRLGDLASNHNAPDHGQQPEDATI